MIFNQILRRPRGGAGRGGKVLGVWSQVHVETETVTHLTNMEWVGKIELAVRIRLGYLLLQKNHCINFLTYIYIMHQEDKETKVKRNIPQWRFPDNLELQGSWLQQNQYISGVWYIVANRNGDRKSATF